MCIQRGMPLSRVACHADIQACHADVQRGMPCGHPVWHATQTSSVACHVDVQWHATRTSSMAFSWRHMDSVAILWCHIGHTSRSALLSKKLVQIEMVETYTIPIHLIIMCYFRPYHILDPSQPSQKVFGFFRYDSQEMRWLFPGLALILNNSLDSLYCTHSNNVLTLIYILALLTFLNSY